MIWAQFCTFLPHTGGNSLHAVRCVHFLNTQLAAYQVPVIMAISIYVRSTPALL